MAIFLVALGRFRVFYGLQRLAERSMTRSNVASVYGPYVLVDRALEKKYQARFERTGRPHGVKLPGLSRGSADVRRSPGAAYGRVWLIVRLGH